MICLLRPAGAHMKRIRESPVPLQSGGFPNIL